VLAKQSFCHFRSKIGTCGPARRVVRASAATRVPRKRIYLARVTHSCKSVGHEGLVEEIFLSDFLDIFFVSRFASTQCSCGFCRLVHTSHAQLARHPYNPRTGFIENLKARSEAHVWTTRPDVKSRLKRIRQAQRAAPAFARVDCAILVAVSRHVRMRRVRHSLALQFAHPAVVERVEHALQQPVHCAFWCVALRNSSILQPFHYRCSSPSQSPSTVYVPHTVHIE